MPTWWTICEAFPNAIERIELITNPSSKYDAAGNAGIIDIRMKKISAMVPTVPVTAGYGQEYIPKQIQESTSIQEIKTERFLGYNYAYRMQLNHLILDRNFYTDGVFTGKDNKDNYTKIPMNFQTIRLGVDWYASSKTILGMVVNSNISKIDPFNRNSSTVSDNNKEPVFNFNTQTGNHNRNKECGDQFLISNTFDSTGKELTADLDLWLFWNGK